jgi:hypothetical protein
VDAYILTGKGELAELLARTAGGEPILARQAAGVGRSVCLAVPLGPGRNEAWQGSPQAARLAAAAVRWAMRRANDSRFAAELTREGSDLVISVTAGGEGAPLNDLSLRADVSAGGAAAGVALEQVRPGRYEGRAVCPADVPAAVAVRDEKGAAVWRGAAPVTCAPEYRLLGADREALRRLAALTGGRLVPAGELPAALRQSCARRRTDLWPWLVGLALALMLAEWCLTRITRA